MGSATQDVFVKTDCDLLRVCHHQECEELLAYPVGEKILIEHLAFEIGGGGTNTATTFARQGLKTGWLGKLGEDPSGYMVLNFLAREGIAFLGAKGEQTGYSVILDSEEEDRTILTYKGANNTLQYSEIEARVGKLETKWLYCSSMLEESYRTMLQVMQRLRKKGTKVAFNPSNYQAEQGLGKLQELLDHVDLLILNREEAELLTGHQSQDMHEVLRVLGAAGPDIVVITDAARGALLFDGERIIERHPHPNLTLLETTGAGDAFGSGLVAGLVRGLGVEEALELAFHNAESVIAHYGAKNKILTREESEKLMRCK